ncbi:MAG: hypothetical protein ACK5F0_03240 [Flavobacteriales bacterium]|jgi:hypothetical protein
MKADLTLLKTRIPVSDELRDRCLKRQPSIKPARPNWLVAASFLVLISLNVAACFFVIKQQQGTRVSYLNNFESYE